VRIGDFQVVVAQAIRSRGTLPSTGVWEQLARRLDGEEAPRATIVDGSDDAALLRERLGLAEKGEDVRDEALAAWTQRLPIVRGSIGIAQPGLSAARMREELQATPVPAGAEGLRQLFSVLLDTAISDGADLQLLVSK
jgi:hypothetical protein